ncbi:hypothetical protein PIB30_075707 [Stylosanthes scabra]|uniref:Uncharacterized protein n=1 Tax=Stylosanthes scabra TaxID=79078 RepID=A0ABU6YSN8_9FABA|nr:hypothetical protein [Stylosanthes scabra]
MKQLPTHSRSSSGSVSDKRVKCPLASTAANFSTKKLKGSAWNGGEGGASGVLGCKLESRRSYGALGSNKGLTSLSEKGQSYRLYKREKGSLQTKVLPKTRSS